MKRWIKVKFAEFQLFIIWRYCYTTKNTLKFILSIIFGIPLLPILLLSHFAARIFSYIEDNISILNPVSAIKENPEYSIPSNRKEKIEYYRKKFNIK